MNSFSICGIRNLRAAPIVAVAGAYLASSQAAHAHHGMEGQLPSTWAEGLLSGLAHPVIGLDHLLCILAVGLLAATRPRGVWIPVAFILAAMAGAAGHLAGAALPGADVLVSATLILLGGLLALGRGLGLAVVVGLAGASGLLHGYVYAESIFGSEATPLAAYLIGFTAAQLGVALLAYGVGRTLMKSPGFIAAPAFRFAGIALGAIGLAFVLSQGI